MTKVLIIEDDPIIANIYRSRLEREGFQVEIAADGQSGFYRIHESRPNGVLLDLMLPKMDGIQILKKIRAQKQFQDLPVLVFTNAYLPQMIQEAKLAGATQVFNKAALTPRQIVEAMSQAIGSSAKLPSSASPAAPELAQTKAIASESPKATTAIPPSESIRPVSPAPSLPAPATSAAPRYRGIPMPAYPAVSNPQPPPAAPSVAHAPRNPPNTVAPSISTDSDAEFQAELLRTFIESSPQSLAELRKSLHDLLKNNDENDRKSQLAGLCRKVHSLTGNAAIVGLTNIAQMSAALEALLKELIEKPSQINASALRTVAHSVDFIGTLLEKGPAPDLLESPPASILVVDDEVISRRAVMYALEKAHLKSESIEDPVAACQILAEKHFDLIILDVDMPGMSGFELCSKLRALPANSTTPVLFVTGLTDFESRARSSLSGGNDLIAKPFLFIELTVKALTFVMKGRLGATKPSQ